MKIEDTRTDEEEDGYHAKVYLSDQSLLIYGVRRLANDRRIFYTAI